MDDQMDQDALATELALEQRAREHARLADAVLGSFPVSESRSALEALTGFVLAQRAKAVPAASPAV